MTQAIVAVGLTLVAGLAGTIYWLSKARTGQVRAEEQSKSLRKGHERDSLAHRIMEEPSAFEPRWLRAARQRVRDRDRES